MTEPLPHGLRYRTYKWPVPEHLARELEEALMLADWEMLLDSSVPGSGGTRRLNALEKIIGSYLPEARFRVYGILEQQIEKHSEGAKYGLARMMALVRDHHRCVRCQHTRANAGAVESHHILPKNCKDARLLSLVGGTHDVCENLATLCSRCHDEITNPETHEDHWAEVAAQLWRATGNPAIAAKYEALRIVN